MTFRHWLPLLLAVTTISAACSSSSETADQGGNGDASTPDGGPAGDGGGAGDAANASVDGSGGGSIAEATRYWDAYCDYQQRCRMGTVIQGFGDLATCKARMGFIAASLGQQPGNGYTESAVNACIAALTAASCADPMPACTLRGTLPDGTGCIDGDQCSSGYCDHAVSAGGKNCRGACHPFAAENENCKYTQCAAELYCTSGATQTCQKRGGAGAACKSADECLTPLECAGSQCTAPLPFIATHGACTISATGPRCNELAGEYCLVGDASLSGTCEPVAFANPGETCGLSGTTATMCRAGVCRFPNHNTKLPGTCIGDLADNAACDPTTSYADGPNCMTPGGCDKTTKVCMVGVAPICP